MSRVPPEVFDLPIADRIDLAQALRESVLENPEALPLTDSHKDELDRRWRAFEANPDEGESWETLKKSLLN